MQTIIHPSISSIREEAIDIIMYNANRYMLQSDYGLGDGYCDFEQMDAEITVGIINRNNCELLGLISKEIERVEKDDKKEKKEYLDIYSTSHKSLYDLWLSKGNVGTPEQFLNLILTDEKVNWDEVSW